MPELGTSGSVGGPGRATARVYPTGWSMGVQVVQEKVVRISYNRHESRSGKERFSPRAVAQSGSAPEWGSDSPYRPQIPHVTHETGRRNSPTKSIQVREVPGFWPGPSYLGALG
jgi:hypothetical protein